MGVDSFLDGSVVIVVVEFCSMWPVLGTTSFPGALAHSTLASCGPRMVARVCRAWGRRVKFTSCSSQETGKHSESVLLVATPLQPGGATG